MQSKLLKSAIVLLVLTLSTHAFSIGKTGNNILFDAKDRVKVSTPSDYPIIIDRRDDSVLLRSMSFIMVSPGFYDQASFGVFSFRDRYHDLVYKSLNQIEDYFIQTVGMHYKVISSSSARLILFGESDSNVVGIIVAPNGRGLVLVGINSPLIKQGILDTMNGVVFQ